MTGQRGPQPQPGGGSGKLPCSRCGAWNYATDAVCLSCGADLEAPRFHPPPPAAERKPEGAPAVESPVAAPPDLPLSVLGLRGWIVTRTAEDALRMVPGIGSRLRQNEDRFSRGLLYLFFGGLYGFRFADWVARGRPRWPYVNPGVGATIFLLCGMWMLASFCVREEWEVGPDRLTIHRALSRRRWKTCYTQARLEVRKKTAYFRRFGRGQPYYQLAVHDPGGRSAILSSGAPLPSDVCTLGRFLAEQTGWPLSEPRWLP